MTIGEFIQLVLIKNVDLNKPFYVNDDTDFNIIEGKDYFEVFGQVPYTDTVHFFQSDK